MTDNVTPAILVVDDDLKIARLVRSYLEQSGFAVEMAHDGKTALQAIRSQRPDLVVLDLTLPQLDGLEVTRTIRNDPTIGDLPILMLTARVDDIDRILGLEMGADDYVTKPFNPREVVARVKAILRRSRPASSDDAVLSVADVVLYPSSYRVEKAGSVINLTPSEFDILHLLMNHPGQAFSRTQIIEQGLGYEYAGLERTVDSHIKNLRRKLEDDPTQPQIVETVFGVGYRLRG
ncbi:MAG: response regulator transcription factor [Caldilineaceae bacterium]|nr:response regulator transcription factor [Caldilineaceae bacterium]